MSSYHLLSPWIRKYIYDLKWGSLSPIQEESIQAILENEHHLLLSAGTASGKTEAAFLPIMSKTMQLAKQHVAVLHVLPLKALINDQFERIEAMCSYADIEVMKWHGDVSSHQKEKWLRQPKGILQITPESLESLLMNKSAYATKLWSHLQFIVIDEAHVFFGSERGIQLRSLISRVAAYQTDARPRIIALSATVNDENKQVRQWMIGDQVEEELTSIEASSPAKPLLLSLIYTDVHEDIVKDVSTLTDELQSMIFCNSRSDAEQIYAALDQRKPGQYLIHHSSIDAEEREKTEKKMKQKQHNKSIVCTGTLEMGIDLGAVDLVVQKEGAFSVSSLKQRIGRTGRRAGKPQMLQLYASHKESLLRAIATLELVQQKWVEPPVVRKKPYDILIQQILSYVIQHHEATEGEICLLLSSPVFQHVHQKELRLMLKHLLQLDVLQFIGGKYIIGLSGEKLILDRGLYAVFTGSEQLQLFHGNKAVGVIDQSFAIEEGKIILLAGASWKIEKIQDKKAYVTPAPTGTGEKPVFNGSAIQMHSLIGEAMMDALVNGKRYSYLSDKAFDQLQNMRGLFNMHELTSGHRLIIEEQSEKLIYVFQGSKVAQTLVLMLRSLGYKAKMADELFNVKVEGVTESMMDILEMFKQRPWEGHRLLAFAHDKEKKKTKFMDCLPQQLQEEMMIEEMLDIQGTLQLIHEKEWFEVTYEEKSL